MSLDISRYLNRQQKIYPRIGQACIETKYVHHCVSLKYESHQYY